MPLEFHCPDCKQLLRVPDGSAGKNARCPQCSGIIAVPLGSSGLPPTLPPTPHQPPAVAPVHAGQSGPIWKPEPKPAANPFAEAGTPFATSQGDQFANPYASPALVSERPYFSDGMPIAKGQVQPTIVDSGVIMSQATRLWQEHLGILVGVTVVYFVLSLAGTYGLSFVHWALLFGNDWTLLALAGLGIQVVSSAWQSYLNVGFMQICFRLGRREQAELSHLFMGGRQFLPFFAVMLTWQLLVQGPELLRQIWGDPFLADPPLLVLAKCTILVCAFLLWLFYWPVPWLIADGQCSLIEAFGLALRITHGNKLTSFVLMLLSIVIVIAGALAVCVGLLFAVPLVYMLWALAYLMMAGQILPYSYQQPMYR